ncbi:MAG: hypothetical protein MUO99_01365, partial [Dehalococcoidales bacterium]|nr:hypothetical protein [Dehalococcoidales bacterium]
MADIQETQQVPGDDIREGEEGEQETPEPGAEQTPQAEEVEENPKPGQARSEIKVIIIMKADRIMLGVQAPECDPVYTPLKGGLGKALKKVPGLVAEA